MHLVGEAIVLWAQKERVGIIDSTPIEASRYDGYAPFHPHYQVKMDKAHIFHLGPYPLTMVYSNGTDADLTHLFPLIERVEALKPKLSHVLLDTGYDSYEAHAHLWYHLNTRPCIDTREGSIDPGRRDGTTHPALGQQTLESVGRYPCSPDSTVAIPLPAWKR